VHTLCTRLRRGDDIYMNLKRIAEENEISAACVLSMVGCVSKARLRCAGGEAFIDLPGPLEIVSCTGTLSKDRIHIHASFSNRTLNTFGGHMREGCIVDTTAEVVLFIMDDTRFLSRFDEMTGYNELEIQAVEGMENGREGSHD